MSSELLTCENCKRLKCDHSLIWLPSRGNMFICQQMEFTPAAAALAPVAADETWPCGCRRIGVVWSKCDEHTQIRGVLAYPLAPVAGSPDLHQQIMNLPCNPKGYGEKLVDWRQGYHFGHRDARHAAAELVGAPSGAQTDCWECETSDDDEPCAAHASPLPRATEPSTLGEHAAMLKARSTEPEALIPADIMEQLGLMIAAKAIWPHDWRRLTELIGNLARASSAPPVVRHQQSGVPMQFRKKPVVIEAVEWTGANVDEVLAFIVTKGSARREPSAPLAIYIDTLEGTMRADKGDWIIRCVKGEFYPCKPDIFAATYDPVMAPASGPSDERS